MTQVAWALLQDSYHTALCLRHSPNLLATAVLYLALLCCKLDFPGASTATRKWWEVTCPGCEERQLQDIAKDIMAVYDEASNETTKKVKTVKTGTPDTSSSSSSGSSGNVVSGNAKEGTHSVKSTFR